jgi:hypothetical protein
MKKILLLEEELKINQAKILKIQDNQEGVTDKEYRGLLLQRSNIKDMLLNAYREKFKGDSNVECTVSTCG